MRPQKLWLVIPLFLCQVWIAGPTRQDARALQKRFMKAHVIGRDRIITRKVVLNGPHDYRNVIKEKKA